MKNWLKKVCIISIFKRITNLCLTFTHYFARIALFYVIEIYFFRPVFFSLFYYFNVFVFNLKFDQWHWRRLLRASLKHLNVVHDANAQRKLILGWFYSRMVSNHCLCPFTRSFEHYDCSFSEAILYVWSLAWPQVKCDNDLNCEKG